MTRRISREDPIHISIVGHLQTVLPYGWLVVHTPNAPRSAIAGARLKRLGMKAGMPDLTIYGPHEDGYPPCHIEVKGPKGRLQPEQGAMRDVLLSLGHKWGLARSIEDADELIRRWDLPALRASVSPRRTKEAV